MFGNRTAIVDESAVRTVAVDLPVAPVAPADAHEASAGAAAESSSHAGKEPTASQAVRASVDQLIDQANRFEIRNELEAPGTRKVTYQYD